MTKTDIVDPIDTAADTAAADPGADTGSRTAADPTTTATVDRRSEFAVAAFGTWMIIGLFIDGWAHVSNKPETFFSPWHGILYSGFVAALVWSIWDGYRSSKAGREAAPMDALTKVGLITFIVGAVGDGLWHEIFGVEVDIEALVSPSHLALFFGGLLMVSTPLRLARARGDDYPLTWREWLPQGVSLTLTTGLIGFFTQYLSPFEGVAIRTAAVVDAHTREVEESLGVGSVMVFNALLIGALLFALRTWRPPAGTATLLLGGVAIGMAGLEGFALVELALPAIAAGVVADVLIHRGAAASLVAAAASLVMWSGFFAAAEAGSGLAWSVELWAGTIVLAVGSALLLASVIKEPAR